MNTKKFLLIVIPFAISLLTCSENDSEIVDFIPSDSTDIPLTEDQANFLATLSETVIPLENIFLDDGQNVLTFLKKYDPEFLQGFPYGRTGQTKALTPFQQKQRFFSEMYVMGYNLADDSQHTHPSEGPNSPAQTGLAYSWGSKDYNIRQVPPVASGCMDLKIYGLDCTGMLWAMTQAANLTVVPKFNFFVQYISSAQKWTDAFKKSSEYKDLEMKDMGQLPPGKIQNGDIIFWSSHIGVFLYGQIYQSNGTANAPGCKDNLLASRGPRMIPLAEVLAYGLGPYKVFRTIHKLDFALKIEFKSNDPCGYVGQSEYDAVEVDVHIQDDSVSVDNIVNHAPTVAPSTIPVFNCSLNCNLGSTGHFNVVSGTGKVEPGPDVDDELRFYVELKNTGSGKGWASKLKCPEADTIVARTPPYDHVDRWTFLLLDSAQREKPEGNYGIFVTLDPK